MKNNKIANHGMIKQMIVMIFGVIALLGLYRETCSADSQKISLNSVGTHVSWWYPAPDKELRCFLLRSSSDSKFHGEYIIQIHDKTKNSLKKILEFAPGGSPYSIFPLGKAGNSTIVTIWERGSGYAIVVLQYKDNTVKQIFSAGSKLLPEILHVYDDQNVVKGYRLVITDPNECEETRDNRIIRTPAIARVFEWVGSHGTDYAVAWNDRFLRKPKPFRFFDEEYVCPKK